MVYDTCEYYFSGWIVICIIGIGIFMWNLLCANHSSCSVSFAVIWAEYFC
jgi:hypothetical protein